MRRSLYPRLAWEGLRKNRQLSWPYLMTCICMVAMFYILSFMASSTVRALIPHGSDTIATVMAFGSVVALAFSTVFLFYTYSFLNRRRTREFGLYNVLGMGKRDLAKIVCWESLLTAGLALMGGLTLGLALSKLAELGLVNLMEGEVDYRLRLDGWAVCKTVVCFAVIFAMNAVAAVIRTARGSAVSLLKAESVGEKPPKGNWLLAVLGGGVLVAAYALALSVQSAVDALMWFFVAVLMVIAATYMLMIAGSVWLCRVLQKNRGYYYRPNHFVSVSSMAYRMKRNGAGLASICIIATMVLVILSTTTCLWFGSDDAIRARAPRDINLTARLNGVSQLQDGNLDRLREAVEACAAEHGVTPAKWLESRYVYLAGRQYGDAIQCDHEAVRDDMSFNRVHVNGAFGALRELYLISESDYARQTGTLLDLADEEAALLLNHCDYGADALTIAMGDARRRYRVVSVESGALEGVGASASSMTVIVPDLAAAIEGFAATDSEGQPKMILEWTMGFDTGMDDEANMAFGRALSQAVEAVRYAAVDGSGWRSVAVTSKAVEAVDFHASYAGLLFIGILLSAVFLLAAVLIVYYKQVSEGYEDARRFDIMQKVGMTKPEIKRSIASQLLVVFGLPLLFAALHLTFAFPMIRKVLTMLGLRDFALFVRTTIISFTVFAAFYTAVYRLTSGVYYRIVSGAGETNA